MRDERKRGGFGVRCQRSASAVSRRASMMAPLEVRELRKSYGDFDLHVDSLRVNESEIVALVGENGSGKSTFLEMLLGLRRPDSGTVLIFGEDASASNPRFRQKVGSFYSSLTFHSCLKPHDLDLFMRRIYDSWDSGCFEELLRRFDVPAEKTLSRMSKGNVAKLMICASLAHSPRLIVYDEPFSSLDPQMRRVVMENLKEYVSNTGCALVYSTHLVEEARVFADRTIAMEGGMLDDRPSC